MSDEMRRPTISFSCFRVFVAVFVVVAGVQTAHGDARLQPRAPRNGDARPREKNGARGFSRASASQPDGSAVERGRQTFLRVGCYQCHGREAQGASTGPRLGPNPLPLPAFTRAVRTPRNDMPPYGAKLLSDAELADVHAFVAARARPHMLAK